MVLCDHCRDALASVLDPLLDATSEDVEPSVADVMDDAEPGSSAESDATASAEEAEEAEKADGEDGPADERAAEARMASTGAGSSSRVPKGYRKTLRFLENRDMPVQRADAVEMVSGAYGLEPEAVEAAIDHAASHGRLKLLQDEIHRA
ncbi:hypothetical protein [Halosegnis marinus]